MADLATTVERWQQSASQGQQRYVEGVASTQKDVVGLAINAQSKMAANYAQAISSGRWARRLSEVGTAGWKAATQAKASNYSTGIAAGRDKYQRAMTEWLPRIHSAAASVQSMPNNNIQDALARSNAFAMALHNAKLAS